jgi:hypothetical protein
MAVSSKQWQWQWHPPPGLPLRHPLLRNLPRQGVPVDALPAKQPLVVPEAPGGGWHTIGHSTTGSGSGTKIVVPLDTAEQGGHFGTRHEWIGTWVAV